MLLCCPHPLLLCRPPSHTRGVQLGSGHGGGATTSVAAVPREIRVPASSLARRSGRRSTRRNRALLLPAMSRIRGGSPAPATTTPTSSRPSSSKRADVAAEGRSRARRSRHLRRPQARYSLAHPWPVHRRAQVRERMRTARLELTVAACDIGAKGGARRGNARWGVAARREAALPLLGRR
jgi:hypothetical protein